MLQPAYGHDGEHEDNCLGGVVVSRPHGPLHPGDQLPSLALPRLDTGVLDFAALRGKRVLLFFWGSW